jgi:putative MATE family efflux protein
MGVKAVQLLQKGITLDARDRRRILAITLPAMVELVFSQLFAMVDTIMLGQSKNSAIAIAAVGLTNNPMNLLIGVLSAMNVGTSAAVAWAIGAKDSQSARVIARTAVTMNLLLGTLASVVLCAVAGPVVNFMGAQADTYAFARTYLQIVAIGLLPACICFGVTSALRGAGMTRLPMVYNLLGNLLNVIGNYALIYGKLGMPEMGVAGAAISTTLSRYVTCLLALGTLFFVKSPIRMPIRGDYRLHRAPLGRITGVGVTSALEQLIMQIGFIFFTRTVSGLGTEIFAAHQIGLSVNGLTWMPPQAFGVAATALVGQAIGAKDTRKARELVRMIHRYALVAAGMMCVFLLTCSHLIARAYTNDAQVAGMAGWVVKLIALGIPGIYTQLPVAAALRGAGDAKFPLVASALGIWIFRVAVAPLFVYTFGWGLAGAWMTIVLDQTTRAVVVYARFLTGKWMHMKRVQTD